MTAFFWMMRRLSMVFFFCAVAVLGLIVLVEGVEQSRGLSTDAPWALYVERLCLRVPVLFRDLIPSVFALGTVIWWVRFRLKSWPSLQAAGVSLRMLLGCVFTCALFWSLVFSVLTEHAVAQREAVIGESHWAVIDGQITRSGLRENGDLEVLVLNPSKDTFLEPLVLTSEQRSAYLSFLASPEPSMAALTNLHGHPDSAAKGWMAWRWVSPLLPAFIAVILVLFGLSTALSLAAYALIAGVLGLVVQMVGKTIVYGGLHPVMVPVALMMLAVGLWRAHFLRAYSPKTM